MSNTEKKIIFSGIKPSGELTLGNYLGAIKNWVRLQDEYECLFCVVDLHAITVRQEPELLRRRSLEILATYIACGIDPSRCTLFLQSHVPAHAELGWVLGCYSMFGELSRMTQFKEKSATNPDNVNGGLFMYPVLMAADILLYRAHLVPVGDDQKQHVELARNIAERFNSVYADALVVPEPYIPPVAARVMSLLDPTKKMSKSDDAAGAYIELTDSRDVIIKKFKRAVTDSEAVVRHSPNKPGVANLMSIYSSVTEKNYSEIEREFDGSGYGSFKTAVGEAVADALSPIQERVTALLADLSGLDAILRSGAEKASAAAKVTLSQVYDKIGFYPLQS